MRLENTPMMRLPIRSALVAAQLLKASIAAALTPRETARTAIRDLDLQQHMPNDTLAIPDVPFRFNFGSGGVLHLLLWGAVIFGAAVILYSLRDSLPMFDRSRKLVAPETGRNVPDRPDAMAEARLMADDLAKLGRFVEAMHVLLLQCLTELKKQLDIRFADSLTTREILLRIRLSDAGRTSFATIVREVERTHFGEQGADERDYLACREHFETLKQTLRRDLPG
jgi:hypothetical protein